MLNPTTSLQTQNQLREVGSLGIFLLRETVEEEQLNFHQELKKRFLYQRLL